MDQEKTRINHQNKTAGRWRSWNSREIQQLRQLAPLGLDAAAAILNRSPASIRWAANRHRISLRRRHERRGRILGQPRNVSFRDLRLAAHEAKALQQIRTWILDRTITPEDLERVVRRAARLAAGAPLCPSCVSRPVEVASSGYCVPCHRRHLAAAHRELEIERAAQRELWAERQRKVRRSRRSGVGESEG